MKFPVNAIITAVLLLRLLLPLPGMAAEKTAPFISDTIITTSQSHLLMFCTIRNSLTPEMIEGVRNGIPVTFTFLVELEKVINNWPDSTLVEMDFQHTLSFDQLKEEYSVVLSEKDGLVMVTNALEKAIETMADVSGLKIIPLDQLEPDAQYALHVKATLAEKTLPMNMHYLVPFISLWNFETDWQTIEFRY